MKKNRTRLLLLGIVLAFCLPQTAAIAKEAAAAQAQTMVVKRPVANVYKYANQNAEVMTQAIYNEPVQVLKSYNYFVYAEVPDGYTGYLKKADLTQDCASITAAGEMVIVQSALAAVYDAAGTEIGKAPMSATFYGVQEDGRYRVTLPDGVTGYLETEALLVLAPEEEIPQGDGAALVETAKKFMGLNYFWGGCSMVDGIDCSGMTYIAARMNGIQLPRDSGPQSGCGVPIAREDAQIGDFIFFSAGSWSQKVNHVGIYIGEGTFIHSAGGVGVGINHFSDKNFEDRYLFMRRMIPQEDAAEVLPAQSNEVAGL